jgi:hypothetical protein
VRWGSDTFAVVFGVYITSMDAKGDWAGNSPGIWPYLKHCISSQIEHWLHSQVLPKVDNHNQYHAERERNPKGRQRQLTATLVFLVAFQDLFWVLTCVFRDVHTNAKRVAGFSKTDTLFYIAWFALWEGSDTEWRETEFRVFDGRAGGIGGVRIVWLDWLVWVGSRENKWEEDPERQEREEWEAHGFCALGWDSEI